VPSRTGGTPLDAARGPDIEADGFAELERWTGAPSDGRRIDSQLLYV